MLFFVEVRGEVFITFIRNFVKLYMSIVRRKEMTQIGHNIFKMTNR